MGSRLWATAGFCAGLVVVAIGAVPATAAEFTMCYGSATPITENNFAWTHHEVMKRGIEARSGGRIEVASPLGQNPRAREAPLTFAAASGETLESIDGRLEVPMLWQTALSSNALHASLDRFAEGEPPARGNLVAAWDFAKAMAGPAVDVDSRGRDGRFVNLPLRAAEGSQWTGEEHDWRHAPRHYAAVHFHSDDLSDAGWPVTAELTLPADLESGRYLVEITGEAGSDTLPVFVTAARPGRQTKLAFLAPTFSYLAYANDRCLLHGANPEVLADRLLVLTQGDVEFSARP